MKSEGYAKNVFFSVTGILILTAGILFAVLLPDANGIMQTLPFICMGIGAGVFGGNLGVVIKRRLVKFDPETAAKIEIEANDERNTAIGNKAKAKAYDIMQILLCILIVVFALVKTDMYVVLALVAAYLLVLFSMIFFLNKYSKEM